MARKDSAKIGEASPASDPGVRVYRASADYALASFDHVFVIAWRKETSLEGIAAALEGRKAFAAAHPPGILQLSVVYEAAAPPSNEQRQALAGFLRAGAPAVAAAAVLFDGSSVRAAFVRGVATGLSLLARLSYPFRVCTPDGAAELFARAAAARGIPFDARAFPDRVGRVREAIERAAEAGRSGVRLQRPR